MMTLATPRQRAVIQAINAALATTEAERGLRPEKPPEEVKHEERVVEAPPERTQLAEKTQLLTQIRELQSRESLGDHERELLRDLVDRYKKIVEGTAETKKEVGVEREKAPRADRLVGAIPLVGPVAKAIGVVDTRDREVHLIQKEGGIQPAEHIDVESTLGNVEEGQGKAAEILGKIRITKDPNEVALLVEDLNTLEREYGGGNLLKNAEVGSFAKQVETKISEEAKEKVGEAASGGAESIGRKIEERTSMAEHRAVHEGDLRGAAAEMEEVSKESISYKEALSRVEFLKQQAAYLTLNGKPEEAKEKLAEMTVVSSSLPEEASKQALVEVPKTPNEMINSIMNSDGLDSSGALKVVRDMHEISQEARKVGMENADVADVYAKVMEVKKEKQALGEATSISGILGDEGERQHILELVGETAEIRGIFVDFRGQGRGEYQKAA